MNEIFVVVEGHIKNAMKLINLGGSINTKNNVGENVLHLACRCVYMHNA